MNIVYIILIVFVVLAAFVVMTYNSFVKLINQVKEAWSDIDVQLKRRYDLIPNLVESVKGYVGHEDKVFEDVTRLRGEALAAQKSGDIKSVSNTENALSGTLKTLFAVSENYPDLKASQNFQDLQRSLEEIESNIQSARRFYNGSVRELNTNVDSFPSNIVAGMFNFKNAEYFELENAEEKENVKVKF